MVLWLLPENQALSAFANEYFTNWQLINWLHQPKSRCWLQDSYPFDLLLQCQIPNHYAKEIENVHMLRTNVSNTLFFQKTTCFLLHLFKIPKLLWNSLNDPNKQLRKCWSTGILKTPGKSVTWHLPHLKQCT